MQKLTLPIAVAINSRYALPLQVMLTSLKERLRHSYEVHLYFVHQGVRADLLDNISRLVRTHSIVPSPERVAAIPRHSHLPPEAAYPLLLPELLPKTLDRILFLDADLLVLDDLAKLWETSIIDRVLGAAPDAAIPRCSSARGVKQPAEWGIPENAAYFNCGVLLINLAEWRRREVTRRAFDYLKKVGNKVDFLHQEALNAVLWNDWIPLESRWNLLGSLAGRPYRLPESDNWQTPGIVHFAGHFKPWRVSVGGPFNTQYRAFMSQIAPCVPQVRATMKERLLSVYDRHLRNSLYGCERALWKRRLI